MKRSKSWLLYLLAFVFLAAALGFSISGDRNRTAIADQGGSVAFEVPSEVVKIDWSTRKATIQGRLRNEGLEDLAIRSITASCGCTVVPDYPKTVRPGKEVAIPIHLAATQPGLRTVIVEVETDSPRTPRLTAQITMESDAPLPHLMSIPTNLSFGVVTDGRASQPFRVASRERGEEPPWIEGASSPLEGVAIAGGVTREVPIPNGSGAVIRNYEFRVDWTMPSKPGTYRGEIVFRTSGPRLEDTVPIEAEVVGPVVARPRSLFASVAPGAQPPLLTLHVLCQQPGFVLTAAPTENTAGFLIAEPTQVADGHVKFDLKVREWSGSPLLTEARFTTNHPAVPELVVPLRILPTSSP